MNLAGPDRLHGFRMCLPPLARGDRVVLVEACVEALEEAVAAERGGAGRVELCANLAEHGTTPAENLLAACVARVALPVFPIIRPRAGDFTYSSSEIETMLRQAHRAVQLGAHGLVIGALRADGRVDRDTVTALQRTAPAAPITFHRAFDAARDLDEALEDLVVLGIARVLTGGGASTAAEGVGHIARLVQRAAGRIVVMAGGGIRAHNARAVVERTGVSEVHARLRTADEVRGVVRATSRVPS